ncbi:UDP-glycosyltransferase 83A1-like [Senna tora]|uniref:UDP-glycosyltransferase 83A1-like n=1 Tax=Senna tora TaxID=362788 RepID=A0A834TRE5_9FABA|nr:UDP-glycosyltransferase 83A1-like [Senna tora]
MAKTQTSHFLVIPFPVLGHVNPFMQFSHVVAKHGCKVTFLNTESSQKRANQAASASASASSDQTAARINFVTLPDGLDPEDERNDPLKFLFSIKTSMPPLLPKLIEEVNELDGGENKISCIVVSMNMGWALEVGQKMGIKGALLFPGSATTLACTDSMHRLIDEGIIDPQNGLPTKKQEIKLCPDMPSMDSSRLPWCTLPKPFFDHLLQEMQTLRLGSWWLCNTTHQLEPWAFSLSPKLLPIGPFIDQTTASFWQEDTDCLQWLDHHPPKSVIYISFGSLAVMDPTQFTELALGLDLLQKPFLWVVRPNNKGLVYPQEFKGCKGKIVGWAPQKKVLAHPTIACFISHCGWNSTMEGVYSGVPFLCWPFFTDQFQDKAYVCDVWKVGMGFEKDENGIITRGEIKKKVEELLADEGIRERSLKLKEMTLNNVDEGGQSSNNLNMFINWAKE